MKNSAPLRSLLAAACVVALTGCATSNNPHAAALAAPAAPVSADPARAEALRMRADELERIAEQRFLREEPECYDRFWVNRCLEQARQRRLDDVRQARALNIEARRIERAVHLAELEAENAARAAQGRPPLGGDGFAPGEPFDTLPAPSADVKTKIPPVPAKMDIPIPPDDPAAAQLRAQREAALRAAEQAAAAEAAQREAAAAARRAEEASAAAGRAAEAEQRRARYDQRIREREAERAAEAEKAGQPATTP